MAKCIKQGPCNKYLMHPNQRIKFTDWYMKRERQERRAAGFECINSRSYGSEDRSIQKPLIVTKRIAVGYIIKTKHFIGRA